jgi:hypothetical protein
MESELSIQTSLMSEPKKDILSLATAQLKFMNLFAAPLFQGVADILPGMQYCVDELLLNKDLFDKCLLEEQERVSLGQAAPQQDSEISPKTAAFTPSPDPPTEADSAVPTLVEPQHSADSAVAQQSETFQRPHPSPKRTTDGRVNEIVTNFSSVTDFNHNEPFSVDNSHQDDHHGHTRQRCSETTEGSSAPNSGDWASQATSATTGRMPLSPSTRGTSIVSRDSFERPYSYATNIPVPSLPDESMMPVPEPILTTRSQPDLKPDSYPPPLVLDGGEHGDPYRNGQYTNGGGPRKSGVAPEPADTTTRQLKKKPSRFRINGLQSLFRKHKSSSPPMQAADTAG